MKFSSIVLASALMITSCAAFADVKIQYGAGSGKVDFINTVKYPCIEDPLPFGPLSFRMVEDKIWVADSVGGKLMQFNKKDGKLVSEFSVLPEGVKKAYDEETFVNPNTKKEQTAPSLNILVEDFAPVKGENGNVTAWWVADSHNGKLVKYSKDGKKLAEITHKDFVQFNRIEVGAKGDIFVADSGARAIFSFDAEGKFLNKVAWEWTGMAVAGADEKLYRLSFEREAMKHYLIATGLDGKLISARILDTEPMFNAKLWWVDEENGELLVTYCPSTGFKGTFEVLVIGLDGKVKNHSTLEAPFVMNRFIDSADFKEIYRGKADYRVAPEGALELVPYVMEEAKPAENQPAEEAKSGEAK